MDIKDWMSTLKEKAEKDYDIDFDKPGKVVSYRLEYDEKGRIIRILHVEAATADELTGTTQNTVAECKYRRLEDGNPEVSGYGDIDSIREPIYVPENVGEYSRIFGPDGFLLTETLNGNTVSYLYDEKNRLAGKEYGDGSRSLFEYNEQGRLLREVHCSAEGRGHPFWVYIYDEAGNMIRKARAIDGDPCRLSARNEYKYSTDGHCIWESDNDEQKVYSFSYTLDGKLAYSGKGVEAAYRYNEADEIEEIFVISEYGDVAVSICFTYSDGLLISRTEYVYYAQEEKSGT